MIIAIDGPAASGKGTLGKRLAKHYGYRHLDTGVIYRAVAKAMLDAGADLTNEMLAVSAALELDPEKFGNPALKTQEVGDAASVVSAFPRVRDVLLNFQRQFAADPPGAVLDGRDIGTVICPHADVKIFVVADPKVRARRRTLEARDASWTLEREADAHVGAREHVVGQTGEDEDSADDSQRARRPRTERELVIGPVRLGLVRN